MRRRLLFLVVFVGLLGSALAPCVGASSFWSQTIGDEGRERAFAIIATSDGGYALAGTTDSFGAGSYDYWLIKTDASGNVQWNKTFGSAGREVAFCLAATPDGGYALAGASGCAPYWLDQNENMFFGGTGSDAWLVKTDASGNMQWNKTYSEADVVRSLLVASDGGYVLAGRTDGDLQSGGYAAWLMKTDSTGNEVWNRTYNAGQIDYLTDAFAITMSPDGGYVMAGYITTQLDTLTGANLNFWLFKTDAQGNMQWNKTYSSSGWCFAYALTKTMDGGYALAGAGGDNGAMLVKTDAVGNVQWSQTYGGTGYSSLCSYSNAVIQTSDGGYALAGYYNYFFTPMVLDRPPVSGDSWLIKTDAAGALQWSKNYGGPGFDGAFGIVEAPDGGFTLAGYTSQGGNYRNESIGFSDDLWLLKTDGYGVVPEHWTLLAVSLFMAAILPIFIYRKKSRVAIGKA